MYYSRYENWQSSATRRQARQVKKITRLLMGVAVLSAGYVLFSLEAVQARLPVEITNVLQRGSMEVHKLVGPDLVATTAQLNAKKLVAKKQQFKTQSNGVMYYQESKTFKKNKNVDISMNVATFYRDSQALASMQAHGGSDSDDLQIGYPSFLKTHGLDAKGRYYLEAVVLKDKSLITIKLVKTLPARLAKKYARSRHYEASMSRLADQNLATILEASRLQTIRLSKLQV